MVYKKQANWKMLQVNLRREIKLNKEDLRRETEKQTHIKRCVTFDILL